MKKQKLPKCLNREKITEIIDHYENQTDEEAIKEANEAFKDSETVFSVPKEAVPEIRKIIEKYRHA